MKSLPSDARRVIGLLYLAGCTVLVLELGEIAVLTFPWHGEVASWRYGTLGALVSRTAALVLADVMLLGTAYLLGHQALLRILGVLHLILGIALLPLIAIYALDTLSLRGSIKPQFVRGFELNALRTIAVCLLGALAALTVFWRTRGVRPDLPERAAVLITDAIPGQR